MFGPQLGPCVEHYLDRDTKRHLNNSTSMPESGGKHQPEVHAPGVAAPWRASATVRRGAPPRHRRAWHRGFCGEGHLAQVSIGEPAAAGARPGVIPRITPGGMSRACRADTDVGTGKGQPLSESGPVPPCPARSTPWHR